jgi:hypothetical protein
MNIPTENQNLNLLESLRRYWSRLITVVLIPSFLFLGHKFHFPEAIIVVLFFAIAIYSFWPWPRGGAPWTFGLVQFGLAVVGIFLVFLVLIPLLES